MVALLKQFYLKKLASSALPLFIAFSCVAVKSVYALEKEEERQTLEGIIEQPQADSGIKKICQFDIENGFERFFLYTLYQIGGSTASRDGYNNYHFPISELKFPLNVYMFYTNLNLTFVDRITIHYALHVSLNNNVGTMVDSDWVPYPSIKTIYSESDARLDAIFNEVDLIARLFTVSFFSLKIGAGFMHQYMNFWCSNLEQESIYDSHSPTYIGNPQFIKLNGKCITYELQYYMLTLQLTPVFTIPIGKGTLEIITAIRFSPYVIAKDIDDHILRGKISKNDTVGAAFMPVLRISYMFYNRIFITAKFDYLYLAAKGEQKQSYYNPFLDPYTITNYIPGWFATIDSRIKSEQVSVSIGAGYSFEI